MELVGDDSYTFENWLPYFARGVNYPAANAALRAPNASVLDLSNSSKFTPAEDHSTSRTVTFHNHGRVGAIEFSNTLISPASPASMGERSSVPNIYP